MLGKPYFCYLAGYISGKKIDKCTEWRKRIRAHYDNWKGEERYPIEWLDPLNGEIFGTITGNGLECSVPGKVLVYRDYQSVRMSDLIIANLDTFGDTRPLTGTMFELAWAWMLKKPVIIICQDLNYIAHPFVKDTACMIVKDIDELLTSKIINYMYKGTVSAIY